MLASQPVTVIHHDQLITYLFTKLNLMRIITFWHEVLCTFKKPTQTISESMDRIRIELALVELSTHTPAQKGLQQISECLASPQP